MDDAGVAADDVPALLGRDDRVLEEAAGVADHRRVGQLGAPHGNDPVEDLAGVGCRDAGFGHLALDLQVAQHRLPGPGQPEAHLGDDVLAGQAAEVAVLEHAVAVAETADLGRQQCGPTGDQIHHLHRLQPVLHLDAIGPDVLHRRGADRAGNQGHVLQAGVAMVQRPADQLMPGHAGAGLDDPGVITRLQQPDARDLDLQHHRLQIPGQHQIAAAAKHELGRPAELRVVDHPAHIGGLADAYQAPRHGGQPEGVVGLQADVNLDPQGNRHAADHCVRGGGGGHGHGKIFADPFTPDRTCPASTPFSSPTTSRSAMAWTTPSRKSAPVSTSRERAPRSSSRTRKSTPPVTASSSSNRSRRCCMPS
mmetsp:Transcript_70458/g.166073  ORF Transcript_70458/g.166073 Transcript_70458/m.166073 type:complete len:365 (-) Transcript_70458:2336-3430(-)